ncbi:MAG: molybdopterin-dependent oxidoreductase [Acidobacteria bacterium]|nr:molybdopterin-dependent oxidoreductase [Acidobacteriota bacterium]
MEKKKTFCSFCSLECDLAVRMPDLSAYFNSDGIMEQDYDIESVNEGSICAKGNFTRDFIDHPQRIGYAERRHNRITVDEAFDRIKDGLSKVQDKHGKDSIAIIGNGNMSREEIKWVKRLAKDTLKTKSYGFFLPDDGMVAAGLLANGYKFDRPSFEELEKADNILMVGDAFYEHPVIAKKILQARYEDRKHSLFVIDPRYSNTAWFADVHLQCHPGAEGLVLMALAKLLNDGENNEFKKILSKVKAEELAETAGVKIGDLKWVADIIGNTENLAIVISDILGKIGQADVCSAYCDLIASGNRAKRHYYPLFINQSVYPIMVDMTENDSIGIGKVLDAVVGGKVKGLVVFGVDLLGSYPSSDLEKAIKKLEFFVCSDTFRNATNDHADILLPAANSIEKSGIFTDLDGKNKTREKIINPPANGMEELEMLKKINVLLGGSEDEKKFDFEDIKEIKSVDAYTKAAVASAEKLLKFKDITSKTRPFAFVTKALPYHWADGSITRQFIWNKEHSNEAVFEIHPVAAEKMKIKEGQKVTIESEFGKVKLPVVFSKRIKENMIAADYHWPEIRALFPLKTAAGISELVNEPIPVSLGK